MSIRVVLLTVMIDEGGFLNSGFGHKIDCELVFRKAKQVTYVIYVIISPFKISLYGFLDLILLQTRIERQDHADTAVITV